MNELALFFGGGGCLLASQLLGHQVVCGVEINPYCREVAMRRQEEGFLPAFPIWDDVKTFDAVPWRGTVDIVTAGFPCQPFSVAGKRLQEKDERNLWPDTMRIIRDSGTLAVMLENVPGIRAFLPVVIRDLRRNGYTVEKPIIVSAEEVGAKHKRERVWILAYSDRARLQELIGQEKKLQGGDGLDRFFVQDEWGAGNPAEAFICRGADGLPNRVDRIKALGNAWVPAVAVKAWSQLIGTTRAERAAAGE